MLESTKHFKLKVDIRNSAKDDHRKSYLESFAQTSVAHASRLDFAHHATALQNSKAKLTINMYVDVFHTIFKSYLNHTTNIKLIKVTQNFVTSKPCVLMKVVRAFPLMYHVVLITSIGFLTSTKDWY